MEDVNDIQLKRELQFDMYGRHAMIRDIINYNRKNGQSLKILDVGGAGNILRRFLPQDTVRYLDPIDGNPDDENFVLGDGCAIPLADESYDWVVSADVFEHIPAAQRDDFLRENTRVARLGMILTAPFYSEEAKDADHNANESYKVLSGGKDHHFLREHIDNKLPREGIVEAWLKKNNFEYQNIPNNNLLLWQFGIGVVLHAFECGIDAVKKEFEAYNTFYNTQAYPFDTGLPAYRRIYIVRKDASVKFLTVQSKGISSETALKVLTKGVTLINAVSKVKKERIVERDNKINEYIAAVGVKDANVDRLQRDKQLLEQQIMKKEVQRLHEVGVLTERIKVMEASSFWKLRNRYLRLKNALLRGPRLVFKALVVLKKHGLREMLKRTKQIIKAGKIRSYELGDQGYNEIRQTEEKRLVNEWRTQREESRQFRWQPLISVLLPVYNVDIQWLKKAIDSVYKQSYENWELCIVDDASTHQDIVPFLQKYTKNNPRVKLRFLSQNQHICGSSNAALAMATGDYVALMDNDDELTSDALYEMVKAINEDQTRDILYSDKDKITPTGEFFFPERKPDFDMQLLLTYMYMSHLEVIRTSLVRKVGGFRKGYEGAQDYDLMLRMVEKTKKIHHVGKILYHWRALESSTAINPSSKPYAYASGKKALEDYLIRNKIKGTVTMLASRRYKITRS